MSNAATDKIQSLFLSYQDLKAEVRRLEVDLDAKKTRKFTKEKELNAMESKIKSFESKLHGEKMTLTQLKSENDLLKAQAEKERAEQYAVYLELLEAEGAIKELNEQRMENKSKFAQTLKEMVNKQFKKREELKKTLEFF